MATPPKSLDRHAICERLPHGDAMVMLDAVTRWNADTILCETRRHVDAANPLRSQDSLHASAGIEFAAQAIALHGLLKARPGGNVRQAVIAGLKKVEWTHQRLDDAGDMLTVRATASSQLGDGAHYYFEIADASDAVIVSGEALVMFATGDAAPD